MASIAQVKTAALAGIDSVLAHWCPGGKQQGREYLPLNPRRADSKPGSFSINLDTGAWADFADDAKGGDLVSLVAYIEGIGQGEAAKLLAQFLGMDSGKSDSQKRATSPQHKAGNTQISLTSKKPEWEAVLPVSSDVPKPPARHYRYGVPSMQWAYRDTTGGLLCLVYRFEPGQSSDRKQFVPLTWCRNAQGKHEWRWQGLDSPRPLYNLPGLESKPDALVIVCEGEKAADAAAVLFPAAVTTTMLNGAQAPGKTDWSPLTGRKVWLWRDNDEAGLKCMQAVDELLRKAGATTVQHINLAMIEGLQDKDDAADLVARGWTAGRMDGLAGGDGFLVDRLAPASSPSASTSAAAPMQDDALDTPSSRFHVNDQGVWYYGKSDTGNDAPPLWICSRLDITAVTRDAKSESWGRLLEFDDPDGQHHAWALPMEMLAGDGTEYRRELSRMGLLIEQGTKSRNLLSRYIQTANVTARARCVERTGWHDQVFVMPDRTIGQTDDERILYQSLNATPSTFKTRGKLVDWQVLAGLCAGNSRLVFAISAAFAGPLLHVTGMESGGFHYRGDSSTGKTTALRVASSVWGGADFLQRWRATDNGLEALASQHSDCLLVLDEISQVDPRAAGEVAYMLANGSGKVRSGRTGAMRDTATWRLLFISSGEAGLAEHMAEAGKKPKAGQEIRLLDIPADAGKGLGLFEQIHGHAGGAAFSKVMNELAVKHYGSPALAFISKLVGQYTEVQRAIKEEQELFNQDHLPDDAGGQAYRAALRFGLVSAAGELATQWGITGWQPGEASQAAAMCFKAWLAQRGGAGNQEQAAMLAQVRQFFELHGEARFTDWDRPASDTSQHAPKTVNRAGYRRHYDAKDENGQPIYSGSTYPEGDERKARDTEYYVFPVTFEQEICKGFDKRIISRLLVDKGILIPDGKGYTRKERLPGEGNTRCYRITSKIFDSDDEA
ncbi:Uncharcterized protein, DUF927 family [Methylobacillus rhizosphaerae]|uniref:Uncharcterized protein, DUF927 family n=1 Tax=Methylobacillus rhizosphaerae TaxID=551994 RepID=A0A238YSL6_9PROT|nr:DUF927 domain-containing protein [Methylobacillus rhizosphaerae]SNR74127.1 Uncharcterized protein, DUF927 family [Methylobacillus rhizosphaerae]